MTIAPVARQPVGNSSAPARFGQRKRTWRSVSVSVRRDRCIGCDGFGWRRFGCGFDGGPHGFEPEGLV